MDRLKYYDAEKIKHALPYKRLIPALKEAFIKQTTHVPLRVHEHMAPQKELLIMPAWDEAFFGIKLVSLFSGNRNSGKETIHGLYCLFDQQDGSPLAIFDNRDITARRTAAVSALAASKLSRPESQTLLVLGYGRLAPCLIEAYMAIRPIKQILVWGRDLKKAAYMAKHLPFTISIVEDLKTAIAKADIITAATRSSTPLFKGDWVADGTHIDLVGAYRADMRETDNETIKRSELYVDTYEGVLKEGGDIVIPIREGILKKEDIRGDLSELLTSSPGRQKESDITLFKSVGTALADLAAVKLVYQQITKSA